MALDGNRLREALGLAGTEKPFPWQEDLLLRFSRGEIPSALDIPTGLGKTAVMAIWLVAFAGGAKLPRRLVYVVDRRAVVDQATEVALGLRQLSDRDPKLREQLGLGSERSLPISTLRGQFVDNREWLEDPVSPAIIVGTVDMIGSRLLFEGYGVSRKMRPYHAGLLGTDALVVLDEAHLVPPFEHLLSVIETDETLEPPREEERQLVPSFRLLSLSATGRAREDAVRLTSKDLDHPIVCKRLQAKKQLRVHLLGEKAKLDEELAKKAWHFSSEERVPVRCLIYCDSRRVAEKAKKALERMVKDDNEGDVSAREIDSELFVGGRRVFEREEANERLKQLGFIAGRAGERTRPAFLFATSAAEVGVDLDADHMVCDLVAWERMVQRLGRVNRRGDSKESQVHVFVGPNPKPTKKQDEALEKRATGNLEDKDHALIEEYEAKLRTSTNMRKALENLPKDGEFADASPGALRDLRDRADKDRRLRKVLGGATTPEPLRPALTRGLVDAWAMTSLEKHTGRPAIGPWLRGWIDDDPRQTKVAWRGYLPVRVGGGAPRKREIERFFEAAPPHTSELLETETFLVREWVIARAEVLTSGLGNSELESHTEERVSLLDPGDTVAFVLEPDGSLRQSLKLEDFVLPNDRQVAMERRKELDASLAGATLVVDARLGGLRDGLLNEKEGTIPRTADDGDDWLGGRVVRFRVRSIEAPEAVPGNEAWRERFRFAAEVSEDGETRRWIVVEKWRHDATTEEDRSAARPQLIDDHQAWAEERARSLAKALRLEGYEEMLAVAARVHDEGKRARRWQQAFNAPPDGLYAKTRGPINYALLDSYRHELGSLLYAQKDNRLLNLREEERELALHLITAHHGFGRPVIGTSGCDDAPPSMLNDRTGEIALRFLRLEGRWGPWGLAWWEAVLRAADQQASRDNDEQEIQ